MFVPAYPTLCQKHCASDIRWLPFWTVLWCSAFLPNSLTRCSAASGRSIRRSTPRYAALRTVRPIRAPSSAPYGCNA
ncbi:hypothetical protein V5799_020899 [Amblyomma americanum]|uniref:Uncharacterized protein n=1 Tax=Amblyomma americanum TaxID=6943 RepID=A0AAQ4ESM1_AMBAM